MKALTILQPWTSLIAIGAKKIETRSWATKYRGPIAIHAGMNEKYLREFITYEEPFRSALTPMARLCKVSDPAIRWALLQWNHGCVIAIAELVDCQRVVRRNGIAAILENGVTVMGNELAFGDYTPSRYAWMLENVRPIEPVRDRGMQRLWEWSGHDIPNRMEEHHDNDK